MPLADDEELKGALRETLKKCEKKRAATKQGPPVFTSRANSIIVAGLR